MLMSISAPAFFALVNALCQTESNQRWVKFMEYGLALNVYLLDPIIDHYRLTAPLAPLAELLTMLWVLKNMFLNQPWFEFTLTGRWWYRYVFHSLSIKDFTTASCRLTMVSRVVGIKLFDNLKNVRWWGLNRSFAAMCTWFWYFCPWTWGLCCYLVLVFQNDPRSERFTFVEIVIVVAIPFACFPAISWFVLVLVFSLLRSIKSEFASEVL